ncbi:MAG: polysaccharide deacetylase family protein [Bilophila sp.]
MNTQSLPVLMYHYVNRFPGATTVSPEAFEAQCRGMAENGWRGVGLDEAEAFLLHGTPLPRRSLLITFDDGYLDTYVYAWPILRKYGHKGVVFAVTDCLEKASGPRPTLADIRSGSEFALPPVDTPLQATAYGFQERRDLFMSWEEARRMEESGVMAVAAHLGPSSGRLRGAGLGPGEPARPPQGRLPL